MFPNKFALMNGLKQEDALLPLFYNFALKYAIWRAWNSWYPSATGLG
jgi:hypothetical protein